MNVNKNNDDKTNCFLNICIKHEFDWFKSKSVHMIILDFHWCSEKCPYYKGV
jgi:hypothetical protein